MKKECYIVGNWKMNPASKKEALSILQKVKKSLPRSQYTEVVVIPPVLYFSSLREKFRGTLFGVQSVATDETHAHTGSISATMAKNEGATYAIIGHSEVRAAGASNEQVGEMLREALKTGLTPILCVGEKSRDHNGFYLHEIKTQLEDALALAPKSSYAKIVVAYEPLWAIGKDALREATPAEFTEIAIFIRKVFSDLVGAKVASEIVILYGGSADEKSVTPFLSAGAQGFLVGRASLDPKKFSEIVVLSELFYKTKK
jgi:triosephosphate isomerase